jgi:histidine triad (HIT) family protein
MSCLFCKIIAGEIPSTKVFEDDHVFAFKDINPEAPQHVLIVPKKHIESLSDAGPEDATLLGHIQLSAAKIAQDLGISSSGYRLVNNCGQHGGQTVYHIHYHLLGGTQMGWPPFAK